MGVLLAGWWGVGSVQGAGRGRWVVWVWWWWCVGWEGLSFCKWWPSPGISLGVKDLLFVLEHVRLALNYSSPVQP